MRLFRNSNHPALAQAGSVVTVGSFDGLHRGHRAIVDELKALAKQAQVSATVVLFEPLPAEYFQIPDATRLYPLRERLRILSDWDVEQVVCLRFNQAFAELSAADFVQRILLDDLNVRGVVYGEDFHFGKDRSGDNETLHRAAQKHGFVTRQVRALTFEQRRISSSWVRDAVRDGDFTRANRLLGRDFEFAGRVIHGDKQGTVLGFPTANLACGKTPLPLQGVYKGVVTSLPSSPSCLINAGYRPTFAGTQYRCEVHIPEFSDNLYGQRLRVRFVGKIRNERKFESGDALKAQIRKDLESLHETADGRL